MKFIYRRTLPTNCSLDPLPDVSIDEATENRIIRKLRRDVAIIPQPYNAAPMLPKVGQMIIFKPCITISFTQLTTSLELIFEGTNDIDDMYLLSDVYDYYVNYCTQNRYKPVAYNTLPNILEAQFPKMRSIKYMFYSRSGGNQNLRIIHCIKGRSTSIPPLPAHIKMKYIISVAFAPLKQNN